MPTTKTLVVSQTEAMHQKVASLLADLRQSQDVLVEVEVRLLTVCDSFCEFCERIGVDFNMNVLSADAAQGSHFAESRPKYSEADRQAFETFKRMADSHENIMQRLDRTFVNDRQLFLILEAAQGDRRSNIVQGPKITLLNGQTGTVFAGEVQFVYRGGEAQTHTFANGNTQAIFLPHNDPYEIGVRITTQPVVSPDRRLVNLYLKVEEMDLIRQEPVKKEPKTAADVQQPRILKREIEKTLAIPCGQTAVLFGGRRIVEHREESGPPIVARIPYVNRYFRRVSYGRDSAVEFVLVTPRIIPLDGRPAPTEAAMKRGYEHMETLAPRTRIADMTSAPARPTATSAEAGKAMLRELEPAPKRNADVVAVLQKAFLQARAEGRVEEAEKLARAILAIDPNIQLQR